MTSRKRIAVGGIHTECSTYNPVLIRAEDFHVLRGDDLVSAEYFSFLSQDDVCIAPLLHARAVPGGPVDRAAYEAFKNEFLAQLADALPLDGVYLAMHGAMHVDGMWDAEGDWITAVRQLVGTDTPIAVSYDLHGNVSQQIIDQIDIFAAYRTAPHIDVRETMERAYGMLLRALRTGETPSVTWAKIPVLMPGERSSTEDEPAKSLYAALPHHDKRPGIWSADQMVGYVWADEPRGTAAAVVTGTDAKETETVAAELAQAYWEARRDFAFGTKAGPLSEMLDLAAQSKTAPVVLAESGDNPTGGGVGDNAQVLEAMIRRNWQNALVAGITDPAAVIACFAAGEGAQLDLNIGAGLDLTSTSVLVRCHVIRLHHGANERDAQAVVQTGGITIVLAACRRPYHNLSDFEALGLDPRSVALLVVKSGYLSPELAPIANPNLMALTDGVVNQDIPRITNRNRPDSTYPWDQEATFAPAPVRSARALRSKI